MSVAKPAERSAESLPAQRILTEVSKRIVGQDAMVERLLIGLLTGGHILLEGSPPHVDSRALREHLRAALPFVLDVHHVHAWSISQERPMVTLHASVAANTDSAVAVREIKRLLAAEFRITHATIEIEYDACGDGPHSPPC